MPMTPGDLPMTQDEALVQIAAELPVLRSDVRLARRSWRFTTFVVVVAIATGAFLFARQHEAQQQRVEDQYQQNIASCLRSNDSRKDIADGFDGVRDALMSASERPATAPPVSPERQAVIDKFNADIDRIVARFAPRDCSKLYPKP